MATERPNINEVARNEHIGPGQTGDNIDAKRVAMYGWDPVSLKWFRSSPSAGMVQANYDYVAITYGAETDTYTFYSGGSGGTVVGTVTLTYYDSTKAQLTSVART